MSHAYWEGKHFSFFQNVECEYFPCHKGIKREEFNCLFCYCPLYLLGIECGGTPHMLENGIKDCSKCVVPHIRKNYGYVNEKLAKVLNMKENRID